MTLRRLDANPLLTPDDLAPTREDLKVLCTLNPAATRFGDQTLLLVRVGEQAPAEDGYVTYLYFDSDAGAVKTGRIATDDADLTCGDGRGYYYRESMLLSSMSHLRLARGSDGVNFTFDAEWAIFPSTPYEAYGCEDARITQIGDEYLITYTAVSNRGVTVALASTRDFATFEKRGVIFPPYQKDVCIFPETVGGMYVCRHRPYRSEFNPASIWTAYSPDLACWGKHEMTLAPAGGWEANRVGCGSPPIRTDEGWLEIYHAADANGVYRLGAMLSDLEAPERIITRSREPIFEPTRDYELTGVYGNCVFHNGLVADADGTLTVYYGAADRICAAAVTSIDEMVAAAHNI
ncbi:MAG: glycoside hydrolase family 130 protein [Phycisphaerae bacterium]|nr:glycoside hydrolase family 130 protein [Phycisphaerae bacterium]